MPKREELIRMREHLEEGVRQQEHQTHDHHQHQQQEDHALQLVFDFYHCYEGWVGRLVLFMK